MFSITLVNFLLQTSRDAWAEHPVLSTNCYGKAVKARSFRTGIHSANSLRCFTWRRGRYDAGFARVGSRFTKVGSRTAHWNDS